MENIPEVELVLKTPGQMHVDFKVAKETCRDISAFYISGVVSQILCVSKMLNFCGIFHSPLGLYYTIYCLLIDTFNFIPTESIPSACKHAWTFPIIKQFLIVVLLPDCAFILFFLYFINKLFASNTSYTLTVLPVGFLYLLVCFGCYKK